MPHTSLLALLLLALSPLALGASCKHSVASEPVANPATRQAAASALQAGSVFGFQQVMRATTIDGNPVTLEARPTALVFFASWCGPCRRELSYLGQIHATYPELRIIGLNSYEEFHDYSDTERLRVFLADNAPWLDEVVSADEAMLADFGRVPKIPTLLIYDAQGGVIAEFRRDKRQPPSHEELESAVAAALQASPPNTI